MFNRICLSGTQGGGQTASHYDNDTEMSVNVIRPSDFEIAKLTATNPEVISGLSNGRSTHIVEAVGSGRNLIGFMRTLLRGVY